MVAAERAWAADGPTREARNEAFAAALLIDDFEGALEGKQVAFDWSEMFPVDERINAKALWAAYDANGVAAHDKYIGKHVEITGEVADIRRGLAGESLVLFETGENPFFFVTGAMSDIQREFAATLKKGQVVRLYCRVGEMILGSPQLSGCLTREGAVIAKGPEIRAAVDRAFAGRRSGLRVKPDADVLKTYGNAPPEDLPEILADRYLGNVKAVAQALNDSSVCFSDVSEMACKHDLAEAAKALDH